MGRDRLEHLAPYVVVGGGPTGAAAAAALSASGRQVIVLDAGLGLEPEREAARRRMAATTRSRWSAADVALTRFTAGARGGAGYKQLFGSDVAFRDDGVLDLRAGPEVAARPSYALGGLSNVWGAGVVPYTDHDLGGWPIAASDLAEGYRAAFELMPQAAEEDELAQRYPLPAPPGAPLLRSDAATRLLARLRARSTRQHGSVRYHFGGSRLAVRTGHPAPDLGCCYCAHCLDGCPYGHIYNAGQTIEELRDSGRIEYLPGMHVDRVGEADGEVAIEATPLASANGSAVTLRAHRVFLAAGALASTIILQRSGILPARAELLDSQTLYLPFLWLGGAGRTGHEPDHTLAQLFLVLEDQEVSAHSVHVSLYTYNDGLTERARAAHPRLASLLGPGLDAITRRLVIGICFLHSDDSQRIASTVSGSGAGVQLEAVENPATSIALARLRRGLRSLWPVGLVPLGPLAERAPAGGGFHSGGSVPMRAQPRPGEADLLGRPHPARQVHVVDPACFPSIPSGTITLPAMANAHRIARAAALEDDGVAAGAGQRQEW
jgi:choline dehydrogenase-like flavoprotein